MTKYVCTVCGYIAEGSIPEFCPVCKAPASKFIEKKDNTYVTEHVVGIAKDVPEEIKQGLRENFNGECSEGGMYLAMSRVADREGYPEIAEAWKRYAFEEAEHASKFAELLGEVLTDSTKKNLQMRVDAECGACAGKMDLAKKAKELNLDAIHDTVHEMAKDEARSAAVQAMNRAVAAELTRSPALCDALFTQDSGLVSLDAAAAGAAQTQFVSAVQTEMDALPEICYAVPFGSLTNNSLLSGLGPGWLLSIRPKGYVQGEIRETTQSLSINTTRYSAVLQLSVTVNMILDGSTATLTVAADYPLASLLVCGDIPNAYASDLD